jgi:hypothetical protein
MAGNQSVVIAASGELTVPALFAAAIDQSVGALYLTGGLSSFASIVRTENYRHSFANFVPDILMQTDLPEILAQLAPRRVRMAGPVGGDGEPLSMEAARDVYKSALAEGHFTVTEGADWNPGALAQFALGRDVG